MNARRQREYIQLIVREAYAAHTILCNMGFEPEHVQATVRNVINAQPPGPHAVVFITRAEDDLHFVYHIAPVTQAQAKQFCDAWLVFAREKPRMPREALDKILYGSQAWEQRGELLWRLAAKGFELRPGEMSN